MVTSHLCDATETDINIIESNICNGEKYITYRHKLILKDAVLLGQWIERYMQISESTFAYFVATRCKFSYLRACRIRGFSIIFGRYKKKLQEQSISLLKAIEISKHIDRALAIHEEEARFWSS